MNAHAGRFEHFYNSFLQHPVLLWISIAIALVVIWSRPGLTQSTRRFCTALAFLAAVDAWLTADHVVGITKLTPTWALVIPTFFILAGDFRYFLLLEALRAKERLSFNWRIVFRAFGVTLAVPIVAKMFHASLGEQYADQRYLFFIYETLFALLTIALIKFYIPRTGPALIWARRVSQFVLAYYSLWAIADALILWTHADIAFALRVIPNLLYYAGLPAFMAAAESSSPPSASRPLYQPTP